MTARIPSAATLVRAGARAQGPLRAALAVVAIALGVALGLAVQTINDTAVNELALGVQTLSGEADLEVRSGRSGFDERVYADLASRPEVAVASPVVEIDARLAGRAASLRILGLDAFRAGALQPALVAAVDDRLDVLQPDLVFPSESAAAALGIAKGDTIALQRGLDVVTLRVGGVLAGAIGSPLAVMDIAGAQTHFDRLGTLSRVDLRLRPGVDVDRFAASLASVLPAGVAAARPQARVGAGASLSRAYRVNLDVLALVALVTGGLLVFSTQALAVVRRRRELALLRVLGATRRRVAVGLVAEGATLGAIGSVLGLVGGYGLAALALRLLGADLGSGFFRGVTPTLVPDPFALALFFALGVLTAVAGSAFPALEAARAAPASALKAGDEQRVFARLQPWWPGMAVLVLAAIAAQGPPVGDLPLFGYGSIALMLAGTLMLMPRLAAVLVRLLPMPRSPPAALALAQLRGAPGQAGVSLASIVASVSLMVSMAIMVHSFRDSLAVWLDRILPADVYVRTGASGDTVDLTPEVQARIAATPGVRRVELQREELLLLDPARPRLVLLAREIDPQGPQRQLDLLATATPVPAGAPPPVWVNEPAAALYGWSPGAVITLPLAGRASAFTVAGIWRDYARQQGAVAIERSRYVALTGDRRATGAALWLDPSTSVAAVREALARDVPGGERMEIATPGEIRALSLRIFDRTFAVTYALEIAAVAIGLAGLSSAFGALVLARRREFGVLRHLGMRKRDIATMLAAEGALVSGIGMAVGLALGLAISLVLIHVVNRQSFHWSMDLAVPWTPLFAAIVAVIALASATAVLSGRAAMGGEVLRAVREDW